LPKAGFSVSPVSQSKSTAAFVTSACSHSCLIQSGTAMPKAASAPSRATYIHELMDMSLRVEGPL